MPTKKPRVQIALAPDTMALLRKRAKERHMQPGTLAASIVHVALTKGEVTDDP